MPMLYLHLLLGGAFFAVWLFIATMLFRDRLSQIRHERQAKSPTALPPPHYLNRAEKPRSARVA